MLDRTLLLLLTVLSVALLTLWMRSHIVGDRYRWVDLVDLEPQGLVMRGGDLWTGEGGVALVANRYITSDPGAESALRRRAERRARWAPAGLSRIETPSYPVRSGDGLLGPLGINLERERRFDGPIERSSFGIGFPLWLPVVVFGAYPMFRFIRGVVQREREERIILGLCPRCGVDVRQGPARCPSCGKRQPLLLPQPMAV